MAEEKSSLAAKFAKFAARTLIVGGLSFAFGIAVGGLIDYHLWHEMAELQPVIQQTSWIQDALRADTIFGGSVADGMIALGDAFGSTQELPSLAEAKLNLTAALPKSPGADF